MKNSLFTIAVLIGALLFTAGCESQNSLVNPVDDDILLKGNSLESYLTPSSNSTLNKELALVRASTAKYHNIQKALADGYVDINLYIPNMGWHYLNNDLLDGTFEVDKPEFLVYSEKPNGGFRLVAVEYAVPLELSVDPPEGFTGDQDVWFENLDAELWTLHAWVWLHNPDGIFADFNPNAP
jgi:hypothetical protein